jgi:spore coat protein U-like protein
LIWGTGTSAVTTTFGTAQQTLTIYGMVPAQQDVSAGSYSDSVVATISY